MLQLLKVAPDWRETKGKLWHRTGQTLNRTQSCPSSQSLKPEGGGLYSAQLKKVKLGLEEKVIRRCISNKQNQSSKTKEAKEEESCLTHTSEISHWHGEPIAESQWNSAGTGKLLSKRDSIPIVGLSHIVIPWFLLNISLVTASIWQHKQANLC